MKAKLYGLIGRRLDHSFSPAYFRERFEREGIAADYRLFPLERIEELEALLREQPELVGLNVTLPYKEQVLRYAQQLSPEVEAIGSANVLALERDAHGLLEIKAYNTDHLGFGLSLDGWLGKVKLDRALVLGTGGAARAVVHALTERGISPTLVSRQPRAGQLSYEELSPELAARYPLWVNATPVGLQLGEMLQLPYEALTPAHYCYDLIYNPSPTRFLELAAARGAQTKDGLEMLHLQADAAWHIWTSHD